MDLGAVFPGGLDFVLIEALDVDASLAHHDLRQVHAPRRYISCRQPMTFLGLEEEGAAQRAHDQPR